MKIGIVGPSPVPFTIGGVENLLWGLTNYINENTSHNAELIKLPSREQNFWDLIDSYQTFSRLDLSHFDLIISCKYPGWMVRHDNHVCYMLHCLRGLYDTYHFTGQALDVPRRHQRINQILDLMDNGSVGLDEFFGLLNGLRDEDLPAEYFNFPGPFIRRIIHFLDAQGLKNVKRFCCLSETVKRRREYFPPGTDPQVLYPPPFLNRYHNHKFEYIFTVSRLDGPKRIDLLVKAMQHVQADINLMIAGTGPQEEMLKKLAATDPRISFLGFVNNEELVDLYANALVIPFVPYEEDYGLITIEAFKSGKPVITCLDSGGSNEFVTNGITGYSVAPEPRALAEKIDYLAVHHDEARRMGAAGQAKVADITWSNLARGLIGDPNIYRERQGAAANRPRMVVTTTFPIYPPQGGGQSRVFNLYKQLARHFEVEIFSFTSNGELALNGEIAPGLCERRFPKSSSHQDREWKIEQKVGIPVGDVAMPFLSGFTPEYGEQLRAAVDHADIVVLSHPYLYHELAGRGGKYKIIYEAQDVEYDLKSRVLPAQGKYLLDEVYKVEAECCRTSDLIITCSQEDADRLAQLYEVSADKFVVVPNGVDTSDVPFTPWRARMENKHRLGLEDEKLVLFMGSWHPPNLEACENILALAPQLPEVKFLLLGSQCLAFEKRQLPRNVGLLGVVNDAKKNVIFSIVDLALNPMQSGSGTNLKMFDYMAAGIPVITTEFGARGIGRKDTMLLANTMDDIGKTILEFQAAAMDEITARAREYVEDNFSWTKIAADFLITLFGLLEQTPLTQKPH